MNRPERVWKTDGHAFSPYPYSTGEAWCRFCGLDERKHLAGVQQAEYTNPTADYTNLTEKGKG